MIRKEYLQNFKEKKRPFSMIEYEFEKIKKENDDNYLIQNNRPLEEDDIRKLSKPVLDKFVDKLLVNHNLTKFLFCSTANSEIKMFNKSRVVYNRSIPKENKKVHLYGPRDIRKMREKNEVINIVKTEVDNKKKQEFEEITNKKKKNDEFYKLIKTIPCVSENTTDKGLEQGLKKVFLNIERKLGKIKLPNVKLDNNDVHSRLYHNAVYCKEKTRSSKGSEDASNTIHNNIANNEKSLKIKNVIDFTAGKEFSVRITDDIISKCYGKHSGGPDYKNLNTEKKIPKFFKSQLMKIKLTDGNSLLHHSVFYQLTDLVKYLIDKKFDLNVKNDFGDAPLHFAFSNNNKEIIQNLLDNGADYDVTNNNNKTPFELGDYETRKFFNLGDKMEKKSKIRYMD